MNNELIEALEAEASKIVKDGVLIAPSRFDEYIQLQAEIIELQKEDMGLNEVKVKNGKMYEASAMARENNMHELDEQFLAALDELDAKMKEHIGNRDPALVYMNLLAKQFFLHDKKNISNNLEKFLDLTSTVVKSTYLKYYNKKG